MESSANIANVQWLKAFGKSWTYTKNKMGPSIDPWGTQTLTGSSLRKIHWRPRVAFDGWGSFQTKREEDHVHQTNLVSEAVWWGRQSNAFAKSNRIRSVSRPAPRCLPISSYTKRSWLTQDLILDHFTPFNVIYQIKFGKFQFELKLLISFTGI